MRHGALGGFVGSHEQDGAEFGGFADDGHLDVEELFFFVEFRIGVAEEAFPHVVAVVGGGGLSFEGEDDNVGGRGLGRGSGRGLGSRAGRGMKRKKEKGRDEGRGDMMGALGHVVGRLGPRRPKKLSCREPGCRPNDDGSRNLSPAASRVIPPWRALSS